MDREPPYLIQRINQVNSNSMLCLKMELVRRPSRLLWPLLLSGSKEKVH